MRQFFGTDKIAFDIVSTRFPGTPAQTRHFESFSGALDEVINARVWGGIHFRTADEQGAKLGKAVANGTASTSSSRCTAIRAGINKVATTTSVKAPAAKAGLRGEEVSDTLSQTCGSAS
jgi:hypothetical protein